MRKDNGPANITDDLNQTGDSRIWILTGNGKGIHPDTVFTPPRISILGDKSEREINGEDSTDNVRLIAFKVQEYLLEDCQEDYLDCEIAYPMHPICLKLLKQQYFQLARGTSLDINILGGVVSSQTLDESGDGLKPDWSDEDYGDAELFWQDGLGWLEDPDIETDFPEIEDYDYLVQDPDDMAAFGMLLQNPPT